jgi:AhpD family alkylhydroperoxidase
MYSKRTFSLVGFVRSLAMNAIYMPRFLIALIKPSTSAALREQVMLGCTSVNDCRYCTWLHTNLALKNAVDVDELNEFISNPEAVSLPKKTAVAVLFAQNFSENM